MVIQDGNLAIEDSVFSGLSFFGQGALVLSNSNVTFINATFTANNNSAGQLWIPLQPTRTFSMAALTFFHMVLTCTVRKQVHFELPLSSSSESSGRFLGSQLWCSPDVGHCSWGNLRKRHLKHYGAGLHLPRQWGRPGRRNRHVELLSPGQRHRLSGECWTQCRC